MGTGQTTTITELFTPTISVSNSPLLQAADLLKTAIAMVSTPDVTMEGNIITDEGAQRSFITKEMATKN